jgi:hypothetical protein
MENKDWGEIEVYNTLNITGRGLVFVTSIEANVGDTIKYDGVTYEVKNVESSRGFGKGPMKTGLIVVELK